MVLLFRLITCLFFSSFKRRIEPLDEGVIHMRVWPNDLDLNVHVNSGRYVSFIDVGRLDLVVRLGVLRQVLRRKWRPIVGGTMITYRRSLMPFERFRIRSRLLCWDEKWFYFDHVVEKSDGQLAARATVRGLVRGPGGNVPPAEFIALTGKTIASPPMPDYVSRWTAAEVRE